MNLTTTELLKTIYVTGAVERNRVSKLLGELAKIALMGEGVELPELPAIAPRGEHNSPLSSTERSRTRRRLQREEQARIASAVTEGSAASAPAATHATLDATHATQSATLDATEDATCNATPLQRVASPPDPPLSHDPPHVFGSQTTGGGSDPHPREGEREADATPDATFDGMDATQVQRVAVASAPLPLPRVPYDVEQAIGHAFARAKAAATGGASVPIAGNQLAILVRAVLAATTEREKNKLARWTESATLEFVRGAQDANIAPNVLKFQDWVSDNRTFPDRRSGVHKAHPAAPAKKRLWAGSSS